MAERLQPKKRGNKDSEKVATYAMVIDHDDTKSSKHRSKFVTGTRQLQNTANQE
jgi:hypothetical protein